MTGSPAAITVVGKALGPAPESRAEGRQAIDDAVAAALIGAISSQFPRRKVQVKLDSVDATPAGLIQRDVRGGGRLLIEGDPNWIVFRFRALYDTVDASVGYPDLVLGGIEPGQRVASDSELAGKLAAEVERRLHGEFAQQPASLVLADVRADPARGRYLRLQASGTVHFGGEAQTPLDVHSLYDLRTGEWLRLEYVLDPPTAPGPHPDAMAVN